MQCVFDAGLLFLHLDLGSGTDLDHRDSTHDLGKPLLQLLTVVVRSSGFDLVADSPDAALYIGLLTRAINDGGVVLVHHYALGTAEIGEANVLQLEPEVL